MEDKGASGNATAVENSTAGSPPAKKAAKSKAKSQRPKSSHPSTAEMVTSAITELKDRKGSSVQAIKKYIASTYKVDGEKFAPFIKRYLKAAVTSGAVVQTKGKGASGSFKLSTNKPSPKGKVKRPVKKPEVTVKKSAEKKAVAPKKAPAAKKQSPVKKAPAEKKPVSPKKPAKTAAAKKVEAAAAKQKAAAQTKNLSKTKKASKAPAAKTKTPKPKTAKAAPKTAKATKK